MVDQADIQAQLQALREGYARQLPEKLAEVEALWQALTDGVWAWDKAEGLQRLTHTLAGSAPTFGFPEVGQQARKLEQRAKAWRADSCVPGESERRQFKALLDDFLNSKPSTEATAENISLKRAANGDSTNRIIYLVEDDTDLASELILQLGQFDYQVRQFPGCADLDEAIEETIPAAIILDTRLENGELVGATLTRDLKARYGSDLPIIFISQCGDFEVRLQAVRSGGDAYFTKPVEIGNLVDTLDQISGNRCEEPYRVLVVDDDASLAAHYALILERAGMRVTTVTNPEEIVASLVEVRPELILMDVYMPSCSGLELAKLIRQQDAYLSIPIVFLSSETNMEKQFSAMRMGGDDFLTKPINDEHLISSVSIRAGRSRTLNALMAQDSLTGLLKHTKIKEHLTAEVSRAQRAGIPLSFALIDIDHFKAVNDNYGHLAGDRAIKSLARLLRQRLRQSDSIGRYGGEEFAVVLPDCGLEAAEQVLNQIREGFANLHFLHEDQEFSITLSAGLASAEQFRDAEGVNRAADEALYEAKRTGRNRVMLCQAPAVKFPARR